MLVGHLAVGPGRETAVPASYAVLFKCHFWDEFAQRQLERFKQRTGRGDIYIFLDETNGKIPDPQHDPDRVIRATEADIDVLGLATHGGFSQFWYSADYALHLLTRRVPNHDYYVMVEFDLVLNADLDEMIDRIAREEVDFVGDPIKDPPIEYFHWLSTADGVYALTDMTHWLTCIAVFSRKAATILFDRRLELSGRYKAGDISTWPMCEIAIPTEIRLAGLRMMALGELGSLTFYQWAPPYEEAALPDLSSSTFVHPVLDGKRFLTNIMRWHPDHPALVETDGWLWNRFVSRAAKQSALVFLFEEERRHGRRQHRDRIVALMHQVGDDAFLNHHGLDSRNIARGKWTTQSSWLGGRRWDEPVGEAVSGVVTGTASFHTEADERPWWMVDLATPSPIEEVRVFNRMDVRSRADGLVVSISDDLREWRDVARHEGRSFGGTDGNPFVAIVGQTARFVRLELTRREYLHLDQVQVIRPAQA